MNDDSPCPNCNEPGLWRESVNVGVGVIYGPYGCPNCGWSESREYDQSQGPKLNSDGSPTDQWGGVYPGLRPPLHEDWTDEDIFDIILDSPVEEE